MMLSIAWPAASPHRKLSCCTSSTQNRPRASSLQRQRRYRRQQQPISCIASSNQQINLSVDWRNHNIHVLFVDRTDTTRGRLAVGMFERIAQWNGLTLCLIAYPCGLEPIENREYIDLNQTAALMNFASRWKFRPKLFTSARQQFDPDDIHRFSILVAMDDSIQAEILRQLSEYHPTEPAKYVSRVCSLADFAYYCSNTRLLSSGGSGLLDKELRLHLAANLPTLRPCLENINDDDSSSSGSPTTTTLSSNDDDIVVYPNSIYPAPSGTVQLGSFGNSREIYGSNAGGAFSYVPTYLRPPLEPLSLSDSTEKWDRTVLTMAICLSGLTEFLMDCRPPVLDYDTDA